MDAPERQRGCHRRCQFLAKRQFTLLIEKKTAASLSQILRNVQPAISHLKTAWKTPIR
jgi:hypothetical protein